MRWPMRREGVWRTLLLLLAAVVAGLALTPTPPEHIGLDWDKLNHTAAFAALAVCAVLGWRHAHPARRLLVLLALLAFGGAIELLQRHVPGRSAEWADLLADAIGIAAGGLLAWGWLQHRHDTPQSPP